MTAEPNPASPGIRVLLSHGVVRGEEGFKEPSTDAHEAASARPRRPYKAVVAQRSDSNTTGHRWMLEWHAPPSRAPCTDGTVV
ncbi:MAG: hypothetical protein AAFX99_24400 [Myxococcota bacterium]